MVFPQSCGSTLDIVLTRGLTSTSLCLSVQCAGHKPGSTSVIFFFSSSNRLSVLSSSDPILVTLSDWVGNGSALCAQFLGRDKCTVCRPVWAGWRFGNLICCNYVKGRGLDNDLILISCQLFQHSAHLISVGQMLMNYRVALFLIIFIVLILCLLCFIGTGKEAVLASSCLS